MKIKRIVIDLKLQGIIISPFKVISTLEFVSLPGEKLIKRTFLLTIRIRRKCAGFKSVTVAC